MDRPDIALPPSIHHATATDAAAIADCLSELGYPSYPDDVMARLNRVVGSSQEAAFVAIDEEDGALVGVVSVYLIPLFHAPGHLARITSLVVKEEYHNRGYGRGLVEAAESFAWAAGCSRIEVTSGDQRLGAHLFYQRVGLRPEERRFVKRREGA